MCLLVVAQAGILMRLQVVVWGAERLQKIHKILLGLEPQRP